jgi:FkbM family methyltransferase
MNLPDWFRRLTYQPFLVKMIQSLHIRGLMRRVYYLLARPDEKIKHVSFSGIEAKFYVNTPLELRLIETPFTDGLGDEKKMLGELFMALKPDDVVYDIGASIGIHSILMAKKVGKSGKIFAFEPESQSFESLQANIKLNDLNNVITIQIALGNEIAESAIYSGGTTADFSLISGFEKKGGQKISVVPGDILVRDKNLPLPNIVKIDVEGYEFYVIQGLQMTLSSETCQMVCCEIHPTMLPSGITADNVIDLLRSYGFNRMETRERGETFHVFFYKS